MVYALWFLVDDPFLMTWRMVYCLLFMVLCLMVHSFAVLRAGCQVPGVSRAKVLALRRLFLPKKGLVFQVWDFGL